MTIEATGTTGVVGVGASVLASLGGVVFVTVILRERG